MDRGRLLNSQLPVWRRNSHFSIFLNVYVRCVSKMRSGWCGSLFLPPDWRSWNLSIRNHAPILPTNVPQQFHFPLGSISFERLVLREELLDVLCFPSFL